MALSVTPTSGEGPYTLTTEFLYKESLFSKLYDLEVRPRTNVGSCPAPMTTGQRSLTIESALLNTGSYIQPSNIDVGSCRTFTVLIRNTETEDIISQESVEIDNLE